LWPAPPRSAPRCQGAVGRAGPPGRWRRVVDDASRRLLPPLRR
jgi:hypothetical protein